MLFRSYPVRTDPYHIYTSAGLKSINLTVRGSGGIDSEVKTNYIDVIAPVTQPIAAFTGIPVTGFAPLGVTFTDSSTGTLLTNWRWDFGDGNITNFAVQTHPYHIYTSAGLKSVNLTVTGNGGTDSEVKTNYINVTGVMTQIGVFRPSTGYWYFDNNLDGTVDKSFRYGGSTDQIIKGDWQGTGRDGIAIFRPSTGYWYFDNNLDGIVDKSFRYGGSTDQIIEGKWTFFIPL